MNTQVINPIRHGLLMGVVALIFGALWAAYMATHHEQLHSAFEIQQQEILAVEVNMDDMGMPHNHDANSSTPHHGIDNGHVESIQHSHSGSLATDAMQRLLRGHIHAMGLGVLVCVLLLIVAFTNIKDGWKKVFGFTFGLGALLYPPAWVIMGFRTVELGPEAAEASIMWLFGPAVGLLIGSMFALFVVLFLEMLGWHRKGLFSKFFNA